MLGPIGDHLWQSTLFAALTALLAVALRRNRAKVRYALWAAAIAAVAGPFASGVLTQTVIVTQTPSTAATQPSDQPPASFEVASVKPNTSGDNQIRIGAPGPGRMTLTNVPLREMIRVAYQVLPFQLIGGPGWIDSERFDVNATLEVTSGPPDPSRRWLMLRSLLAERFKLAVRSETREMDIYELVLVRSDGRLGEKLRVAGPDCAPLTTPRGMRPPPPPPLPGGAAGAVARGGGPLGGAPGCPTMFGPGFMSARRTTMEQLGRGLANQVRRVVVDKTGLTGIYDADLEFTPEFRPQPPPGAPPLPGPPEDGPSIYTAIQEQLGLKLESRRGPVDVIVIERVEALIPD
jgi:uncharacterized protein (TIGR03435 family)